MSALQLIQKTRIGDEQLLYDDRRSSVGGETTELLLHVPRNLPGIALLVSQQPLTKTLDTGLDLKRYASDYGYINRRGENQSGLTPKN